MLKYPKRYLPFHALKNLYTSVIDPSFQYVNFYSIIVPKRHETKDAILVKYFEFIMNVDQVRVTSDVFF